MTIYTVLVHMLEVALFAPHKDPQKNQNLSLITRASYHVKFILSEQRQHA